MLYRILKPGGYWINLGPLLWCAYCCSSASRAFSPRCLQFSHCYRIISARNSKHMPESCTLLKDLPEPGSQHLPPATT